MRPAGTLLPLLREADWNGAGLAVGRRLLAASPERFVPWVSFAYDTGAQTLTVTEEGLREEERSLQELEAEALGNLAGRPLPLREEVAFGQKVLTLLDEYAAARVLDPGAMAEARRRLGSATLVAALPARGILSLRAYGGADEIAPLAAWAVEVYRASPDTRVTPALVLIEDDRPTTLLPPSVPEPAQRSVVRFEAYDAEEGVARFACQPEAGAPLPAADVRTLRRIAESGRLDPQRRVDEVLLVFEDRRCAEERAPELATVPVVVCFREPGGAVLELDEREGHRDPDPT